MDAAVHVLVFPWPRQGHINPMLHFASALVDAGIQVTFLHTEHNHRRLAHAPLPPRLRLLSVPDGLPDDHPRSFLELLESMYTTSSAAYRALLLSTDAPVTCVVADGTMPFAIDIAEELGIPVLAFATNSACSYLALLSMHKLVELGETPFPADDPVCGVPGMEGFLRRRDLPRGLYCAEQGDGDPWMLKLAEVTARSSKACALILNTATFMERPALAHIASRTSDVFAVGPLHARSRLALSASLWQEDDGSMAWLDGHEDRSVIYVSLGSRVHGVAGRPRGPVRRIREPGEPRRDHARAVHRVPLRSGSYRVRLPLGAPAGHGPDDQLRAPPRSHRGSGRQQGARRRVGSSAGRAAAPGGGLLPDTRRMELDAGVRLGGRADGVLALLLRPADQQPLRGRRVEDGVGHEGHLRQRRHGEDGEGGHGVRRDQGGGPSHGAAVEARCRGGGVVVVRVGAARPLHQGSQHQVLSEAHNY